MDPVTLSLASIRETKQDRLMRYLRAWAYYKAEEYLDELGKEYIKERKLFQHMRRVFGYVTQVVDTDVRFVMKRRLSVESKPEFEEDILTIWERSNFQAEKYKLVRYGANLGDAYLIVQDVSDNSTVVAPRIIVANTEDMDIITEPDDQTVVIQAIQEYGFYDEDGRPHRRKWVYYPDRIERYTDDRMDEGFPRPHPFGEVPVIHIKAIDIGEQWGLCSWHNVQGQLDEVNELGSYMNRILLRYADPTLIATGVNPGEKPVFRKGINQDNVYFLPQNADMKVLEYQGSVLSDVIAMIDRIADNIKDQLPELSLAKIREQSGLSGYAVSLHAADFIAKVEELRGNFANGIEWANALALRAIRRSNAPLEEFKNTIVFESILPQDRESTLRAWQIERDLGILSRREMLRRDGLTEEEIDTRLQEVEQDQAVTGFGLERLGALIDQAAAAGAGETAGAGEA
ncbi:MAG: hypothetical protein BAA04_04790 [Firmicutes bacterium ZCTH02-B6]|nr:MAG: hypothetical protein BAA04_04790 [Firmicutes bacterium ZCTH02-B6]